MSDMNELQRIVINTYGEKPPQFVVRLSAQCDVPSLSIDRIKEVMKVISEKKMSEWPDDEWWNQNLPKWFLDSFQGHSLEELLNDPNLWDFGSWLDAMKNPGWEWWSSNVTDDGWEISVTAHSDPYSIDPLVYLGRVSGANSVVVTEPEYKSSIGNEYSTRAKGSY